MKIFPISLKKVFFTIVLTLLLGYCVMNLGPVKWILQTELGRDAFYWIFAKVDWQGTEGAEDLLCLLSLSAMLIPSMIICMATTRLLRVVKKAFMGRSNN